jgi:choline dehydrogenase-like flavoprotein
MRPREFTSYHCVIRPMLGEPKFHLVRNARVLRVNYGAGSGRAESVDYVDATARQVRTLRARAFVVAAGTLDSTEILLRSRSDAFPDGLGNTTGVVGRYLHDHPREWWPVQMKRPLTAVNHPMYISREPFDAGKPLLAASLTMGLASGIHRLHEFAGRRVDRIGVQVLGTMIPSPEHRVTLAVDRSPDDPASALEIDLRFDTAAVGTVHRARDRFQEIFTAAGHPVEIGPFHDLAPASSNHLGGTVRMHRRPDYGVLDEWNRVHGVPNVVVCDASSFTTGPEKNPTLTAMAIAARAARRLASE